MAIGSSVASKALTQGADITTLTKIKDGLYAYSPSAAVEVTFAVKPATLLSKNRSISGVLRKDPSLADAPSALTSGKVTASVALNFTPGSVVTSAYARSLLAELCSLMSQAAIVDALIAGSTE